MKIEEKEYKAQKGRQRKVKTKERGEVLKRQKKRGRAIWKSKTRAFPGGPVAKTPIPQGRSPQFNT